MQTPPITAATERRECPSCHVLHQRDLFACPNCGHNHERAGRNERRRFVPGRRKPQAADDDEA